MLNKVFFLSGLFLLICPQSLYALDWQIIHEQSENTSVAAAQEKVMNSREALDDLYLLGLVYLNGYEKEKALSVFLRMLPLDEDCYEAKWGKAEVMRREYELDSSRSLLKQLINEHPEFSPSYISLAYIKFNLQDYRETSRLALKVIKQGKDNVDAINLARAYLIYAGAKGMIAHYGGPISKVAHGTQIFPNLKRAQEIAPDTAGVFFGFGAFYLLAPSIIGGDIDKAKDYLERAINKDPNFADAYVRLAQAHRAKGDIDKYNEYLDKALALDPGNFLANDIKNRTCDFICIKE